MPGELYSIVNYRCDQGYESLSLRLFCSEGEWKGQWPECMIKATEDFDEDMEDLDDENEECNADEEAKCQHLCSKRLGEALCHCNTGYTLDEKDRASCLDIDECQDQKGYCDQICINKPR